MSYLIFTFLNIVTHLGEMTVYHMPPMEYNNHWKIMLFGELIMLLKYHVYNYDLHDFVTETHKIF